MESWGEKATVTRNVGHDYLDYHLDAPPRVIPRKKYCDITGFATNYKDKETGMFFADKTVHQYLKTVPKTVKDQYLSLRGVERTNPLFQV